MASVAAVGTTSLRHACRIQIPRSYGNVCESVERQDPENLNLSIPKHLTPHSLTLHTHHHPLVIKPHDPRISRQVIIHDPIDLNPIVIIIMPHVTVSHLLAILLEEGREVVLVVGDVFGLIMIAECGGVEAKVGKGLVEGVGGHFGAVADPGFDVYAGAGVDFEGEGGVEVGGGVVSAGEGGFGVGFHGGFEGVVL